MTYADIITGGVTPCVGVWIEIRKKSWRRKPEPTVTPCVGVWIEINAILPISNRPRSLPAWECGLKYRSNIYREYDKGSLPAWECGLK